MIALLLLLASKSGTKRFRFRVSLLLVRRPKGTILRLTVEA